MTEWITATPKRDNPEERYAVPNGIPASRRTGGRFKAQGMKSGVFDLAFVLPDGRAAFIELKAPHGRMSPAQKKFQDQLVEMGVGHAVISDLDSGLRLLEAWKVIK